MATSNLESNAPITGSMLYRAVNSNDPIGNFVKSCQHPFSPILAAGKVSFEKYLGEDLYNTYLMDLYFKVKTKLDSLVKLDLPGMIVLINYFSVKRMVSRLSASVRKKTGGKYMLPHYRTISGQGNKV